MQEIELISGIAVIVLYAALIALVIYLIMALKRIVSAIDNINGAVVSMEKKVDLIATKAEPLIENSLIISGDFKEISSNFKIQSERISGIVDSVKDTTDSIIDFEQKVQKEVETNVFDTLNMVAAVSRGVKTFWEALSGSYGKKNSNSGNKRLRSESPVETEEDLY